MLLTFDACGPGDGTDRALNQPMLDKGWLVDVVQDDAGWHVRVRGVVISTHGCEDEAVGKAAEEVQHRLADEEVTAVKANGSSTKLL